MNDKDDKPNPSVVPQGRPSEEIEGRSTEQKRQNDHSNRSRETSRGSRRSKRRKRQKQRLSADQHAIRQPASIVPLKLNGIDCKGYIRIVDPYPFTFKTFAKGRWVGRDLLSVYNKEFASYPSSYYKSAIEQGRLQVNDEHVSIDYKVKGGDVLTHTVHRHEPAVSVAFPESDELPCALEVVGETETLVAINKPSTLPVHPCGSYNQNCVTNLLQPMFGKVYNINRLDRLTSGLLIVAKSSDVAQRLTKSIQDRNSSEKLYLARVKGKFPCNLMKDEALPWLGNNADLPEHGEFTQPDEQRCQTEKEPLQSPSQATQLRKCFSFGYWLGPFNGKVIQKGEEILESVKKCNSVDELLKDSQRIEKEQEIAWVHVCSPCRIVDHKKGECKTGTFDNLNDDLYLKSVKPAMTSFAAVQYDEETDSTTVLCKPWTGRSHQIRLHLQLLGHPIANDVCYGGNDMWFGDDAGRKACEVAREILETGTGSSMSNDPELLLCTPASESEIQQMASIKRSDGTSLEDFIEQTCVWCARGNRYEGGSIDRNLLEFCVRSRGIWLHALQYTMKDGNETVSFRTGLPSWC